MLVILAGKILKGVFIFKSKKIISQNGKHVLRLELTQKRNFEQGDRPNCLDKAVKCNLLC